jgi:hypothetical protein
MHRSVAVEPLLVYHFEQPAHQTVGPVVHVPFQMVVVDVPCPQLHPECTNSALEEVVPLKSVVIFRGQTKSRWLTQQRGHSTCATNGQVSPEEMHHLRICLLVPEPLHQ